MRIARLRVLNYKGFRDSGWLDLGPSFNVIIGQNTSGKTALLEALRPTEISNKPHRSLDMARGSVPDPNSTFQIDRITSGFEFKQHFLARGGTLTVPITVGDLDNIEPKVDAMFTAPQLTWQLQANGGQGFSSRRYPSHGLFAARDDKLAARIEASPDKQSISLLGTKANASDDLADIVSLIYQECCYVFRAERLNLGRTSPKPAPRLSPNADNLAAAIMKMAANAHRFDKFNAHVNTIFPSVRRISVVTVDGPQFDIRVWNIDPKTEREDLTVSLEETGTGVGQVLAILLVVMTLPSGVIVIDEPNSFLHPGAAKKLMQIMKEYGHHQYIISTHSADLIATCDPDTIHYVRWDGRQSVVEQLRREAVQDFRRVLRDLGIGLSDVLGADAVVWVEGATEEACFPKMMRHKRGRLPLGVSFLAVRNVGDFESRRPRARVIWEVYKRLSGGHPLLPSALAFSFDREGRTPSETDDMMTRSGGLVHFLPRRTYENYLIEPDAIAAIMATELGDESVGRCRVSDWLTEKAHAFCAKEARLSVERNDWKFYCDAPRLLSQLFAELSDTRLEYRKPRHSVMLTDWLLDNAPARLQELVDYVDALVPSVEKSN